LVGDGPGGGGIDAAGTDTDTGCTIVHSAGPSGDAGPGCGSFAVLDKDPGFQNGPPDFTLTDYKLGANSPLIDVGNPTVPSATEDVYGGNRWLDGNKDPDCVIQRDIGADEFDPGSNCVFQAVSSLSATRAGFPAAPKDEPAGGAEEPLNVKLRIRSKRKFTGYVLCVDGPGNKQCKRFRAGRSGGQWRDTVSWMSKFRYRGPGRYRVKWRTPGGAALGTAQSFQWGPCAPKNLTMKGVWKPGRLEMIDRCRAIKGKPHTITHSRQDGDYHISFRHEEAGMPGVLEIIPRDQPRHIPPPRSGKRYRITGAYICDTFHAPGKTEIHPVFRTELLSSGGDVLSTHTGGPQYPGTPSVNLSQSGRFHCRGAPR
jgi:hypothetical protein